MKEKYNFAPLLKKHKFVRGDIAVSLSKMGVLHFSAEFVRVYIPEENMLIKILVDDEKRTVAMSLKNKINVDNSEKGQWRMITSSLNKKTGRKNFHCSVRNLTKSFGIRETISGLTVEEYTDTLQGRLLIFKLPINKINREDNIK